MSIFLLSLSLHNKAFKDSILISFFTLYAYYAMPIFYHKEEKSFISSSIKS